MRTDRTGLGKIPPQCVDIEESVLGDILLNENMITEYQIILSPEMFYKESNGIIFAALMEIYKDGHAPDAILLNAYLKKSGQLELIGGPYFISSLTNSANAKSNINAKKNALLIFEDYAKRELINLSYETINDAFEDSGDLFEIIEDLKGRLEEVESKMDFSNVTNQSVVKSTLKKINDRDKGLTFAFVKTGNTRFDEVIAVDLNQVVVVAGPNGHMKSKYVMNLVMGMFEHNTDIAALWYTMEEPSTKLVRNMISRDASIEDSKLTGKNKKKLDETEKAKIDASADKIESYDIQYVEKSSTIMTIRSSFKLFTKKRVSKTNLLILDNFGLIDPPKGLRSANEQDDYISKEIIKIRDETKGIVIVVHHLNKSMLNKFNIENGYRPRLEDVRGSARIIDYCNIALLVNLLGKHKDLIQEEITKKKDIVITHDNFPQCYAEALHKVNPEPDNEHKKYAYDHYTRGLYNVCEDVMSPMKLREVFPDLDLKEAAELIISKYAAVVSYMENVNKDRKAGYRSNIMDPLTYLMKEYYRKPLKIGKENKEWYLYGDNPIKFRPYIKVMFILDAAKLREGANDDDSVLIRYKANGDLNSFKEIQ